MATKPNFVIWRLSAVSEGSSLYVPGARLRGKGWSLRLHWRRIPLRETPLVPIGIDRRCGAGGIEFGKMRRSEVPVHGSQILPQLVAAESTGDAGLFYCPQLG